MLAKKSLNIRKSDKSHLPLQTAPYSGVPCVQRMRLFLPLCYPSNRERNSLPAVFCLTFSEGCRASLSMVVGGRGWGLSLMGVSSCNSESKACLPPLWVQLNSATCGRLLRITSIVRTLRREGCPQITSSTNIYILL